MTVIFSGEENLHYYHASCIFIVEPDKQYVIQGSWKGEFLTTLSGPYVFIYSPSVKGAYGRTESMTGSWPWSDFEIKFDTKAGAEVMMVRLRRDKTS